jgi:hypothetical protein
LSPESPSVYIFTYAVNPWHIGLTFTRMPLLSYWRVRWKVLWPASIVLAHRIHPVYPVTVTYSSYILEVQ